MAANRALSIPFRLAPSASALACSASDRYRYAAYTGIE